MIRKRTSSGRMDRYVPLAQDFAARVALFHEAVAQKLGLHATDVKVLRMLGETRMTAGDLVARTGLTGAAVTALVDRLETSGYLKREHDPQDRRRVIVCAVIEKVRVLDQLYSGQGAAMTKLLSHYDAAAFAIIADFLTKVSQVLAEQTTKLRAASDGKKNKAKTNASSKSSGVRTHTNGHKR